MTYFLFSCSKDFCVHFGEGWVFFKRPLSSEEVVSVGFTEPVNIGEVVPVSFTVFISRRGVLSSEEVLEALERRKWLFNFLIGIAGSIEMVLKRPFSCTVMVTALTCRSQNG